MIRKTIDVLIVVGWVLIAVDDWWTKRQDRRLVLKAVRRLDNG